jgi:DNA-binding response OmpR family regulator
MIADDEPEILKSYKDVFSTKEKTISFFEEFETSDNYKVQMFIDGDLLLDTFEEFYARKIRIPLVILDVMMPGMDGITTAKEIRKIDPDVMIIFISGAANLDPEKIREELQHDNYYLRKPIDADEFLSMVESLIKNWNKTQQIKLDLEINKLYARELEEKNKEMEKYTYIFLNREARIKELQEEINDLETKFNVILP